MQPKIKFKLEASDIECEFTPEFGLSTNYTDETKVSWRLSDRNASVNVGILPPELSDESTPDSTIFNWSDV